MPYRPYKHQTEALRQLSSGKILMGDVGSGKSATAIAYFLGIECRANITETKGGYINMRPTKHVDLYIITTARKRDTAEWNNDMGMFSIAPGVNPEMANISVTVDSWNNIKKYSDVEDSFFIFDEQRLVGSGAWVKAFYKIAKKNHWILLSATPGDTWSDYIPVFVANGFYKNKTAFEREHAVYSRFSKFPKIDKYIGTKRLEAYRRSIVIPMTFERPTVRHSVDVKVNYDPMTYKTIFKNRWDPFKETPIENISQLNMSIRRLVNTDPSRFGEVINLIKEHDRVIIFYNLNDELNQLRQLADIFDRPVKEWNGHNHDPLPTSDKWIYLVQYTAGAEGWNCTTTDTIIFYSLNYSYKIMEQAMGRIDRMNTPYKDLYYYIMRSRAPIDVGILRALKQKKDFQPKKFFASQKEFNHVE